MDRTATPPDLQADFPPAECAARLNAAMDDPWNLFGERPVIGKVGSVEGRLKRRVTYYNSLHTVLVLQLKPEAGGTRIRGRTGLSNYALVFMALSVGMIVLFILIGFVGLLTGGASAAFLLVGPMLLAFWAAVFAVGRGMGRGDDAALMKFVQETLQAREIVTKPDKT